MSLLSLPLYHLNKHVFVSACVSECLIESGVNIEGIERKIRNGWIYPPLTYAVN